MNDEDSDDPLLSLAQKIAEGSSVDADREKQDAPLAADEATLQSLLEIAAISAAHREAEQTFDRLWAESAPVPRHWGHLIILERIDGGTFGEVYRAHDTRLQIDVALKLSSSEASRSGDSSRVLDEARLLAKVRHENVVRVYGADRKEGCIGLWMDLVKGQTLEDLTRSHGFSEREAINVGIELCRGLAAVHQVGVLHGDIKAHNVIRQDGGRYVIVDFGAGRSLAVTPVAGRDVIGTPVYLAPEVISGEPRSAASDIYSLGVLLFHLVTNDYPVYGTSHAALVEAHETGTPKRLRDLRTDLSAGFVSVIERAAARDPKDRFPSAGALQGALIEVLSPAVEPRGERWYRSSSFRVGTLAATVFLGAVLGAAMWRRGPGVQTIVDAPVEATSRSAAPSVAAAPPPVDGSYEILAGFYRVDGNNEEPLTGTTRLRLKDQLRMAFFATAPTYVYVVNEDERNNAYLMYPLPGGPRHRLLPANTSMRLPTDDDNWFVNAPGHQEHFLVFASLEPLTAFDDVFKKLASPQRDPRLLPPGAADTLFRSVGGLAPKPTVVSHFRDMFTTPLAGRETARGVWVRQLTTPGAED